MGFLLSLMYFFLIFESLSPGFAMGQQDKEEEAATTCPTSEPVGFTALTPQQLRQEIRNAVSSSMSASIQQFAERLARNEHVLSAYFVQLDGILNELNSSLLETQDRFQQLLQVVMEEKDSRLVRNLTSTIRNILLSLSSTTEGPPPRLSLGQSPSTPALSCQQILDTFPTASSGYYYIAGLAQTSARSSELFPQVTRVYCSMGPTGGGKEEKGGWMRMAHIDMTNTSHSCPPNFIQWARTAPPRRLCVPSSGNAGCFSHKFPVLSLASGTSKICGRIIAYQNATPNGFYPFHTDGSRTIDDVYVDGISLTHGLASRTHIWTFVAALDESPGHLSACACSNSKQLASSRIPSFVGDNYFCDTGSRGNADFQFYLDDPLWDGKGCGPPSSCCSLHDPPWFSADLKQFPAGDAIELRVCRDSGTSNENIPFELVELYVK